MSEKIAVVGAGLVGRAWAITFARAGRQVGLWDPDPAAAAAAIATIPQLLANLETEGLLKGVSAAEVGQRIASPASLAEALAGAVHVQECAPEDVEVKRKLFAELDAAAPADVVLASSSTAIMPSRFTGDLAGRARVCRRPSYQPTLPRAGGRDRARTLDRSRNRRAHPRPDGGGRAGPDRYAA